MNPKQLLQDARPLNKALIAASILPFLLGDCGGGFSSSGTGGNKEEALWCGTLDRSVFQSFCGSCPDGWMRVEYEQIPRELCCEVPTGDRFYVAANQCPMGSERVPPWIPGIEPGAVPELPQGLTEVRRACFKGGDQFEPFCG